MSKAKKPSSARSGASQPQRRLSPLAAALIAAAVLLVLCFIVFRLAFGSGGDVRDVLQQYYENLYSRASIEQMALCFPEGALRDEFELLYTMGGVSNMAASYHMQAQEWVGEDVSVQVSLVEQEKPNSTALNEARAENPDVESASDVTFDVKLSGPSGSRTLRGETRLVKIRGQWYLTDYNILTGFIDE